MDLNKFEGTNYNSECELSFAQADNLIKAGQVQAGFELLQKILQYDPQFGKAFNHLGWVYETQFSNYNNAEECYSQAMKCSPDYTPAYLNYAYLLSYKGRFDELKAHLDKALTIPNISNVKDKLKNTPIKEIVERLEYIYRNFDSSDWWDEGGRALAGGFVGVGGGARGSKREDNLVRNEDREIKLSDFAEELLEKLAEIWSNDA